MKRVILQSRASISLWTTSGRFILILGVLFHIIYVVSIFDIYFKSPVVPNITSLPYTKSRIEDIQEDTGPLDPLEPPAKRVVIFIADGCRADKFYEVSDTNPTINDTSLPLNRPRISYLREIIEKKGSWGVSHTRVPTESRPGHVAMFAGMYEDVSAVTKGWTTNPVDFDSIFNQSRASFLFGSPDIVPMFAPSTVPHAHAFAYSHEMEDFLSEDASDLDVWVENHVLALLENPKWKKTLQSSQLILFCHFLGIDTNGHAHRPMSREYLENISLVDRLVKRLSEAIEKYYDYDNRTTFIFSADHGMSNKGAHGDGDPANTRTPLVAWGAGIAGPEIVKEQQSHRHVVDLPSQSVAQVKAQLNVQSEQEDLAYANWGKTLQSLVRKDVMQADVAPLISAVLGLPFPRNSVGVLPFAFLKHGAYRAHAVRFNAQQLYQHAIQKASEKKAHTLIYFQPFTPLEEDVPVLLASIADAWDNEHFDIVEKLSQNLIELCLAALNYFERYDWFFLLSIIVVGYLGNIMVLGILAFTNEAKVSWANLLWHPHDQAWHKIPVALIVSAIYIKLQQSPLTYFLYISFPIIYWGWIWHTKGQWMPEKSITAKLSMRNFISFHGIDLFVIGLCIECIVLGYIYRAVFGGVMTVIAVWPWAQFMMQDTKHEDISANNKPTSVLMWTCSCLALSIFPYLPTEYGDNLILVVIGGICIIITLIFASYTVDQNCFGAVNTKKLIVRVVPIVLALVLVVVSMSYLTQKMKPPIIITLGNWIVSFGSILLPISASLQPTIRTAHGELVLWNRLLDVSAALVPSYILLSISYEVFFLLALNFVLASWIILENQVEHISNHEKSSMWRDVQRALTFLLFINMAFFGTGNVASMSSFEISSTYRFVTVFSPFLMGFLLVLKILIPFLVVACSFQVLLLQSSFSSSWKAFLLIIALSDILSLHFLFYVKNEGSWKEIGNSISMYGIVNAQIIFIPLLFFIANYLIGDPRLSTESKNIKAI